MTMLWIMSALLAALAGLLVLAGARRGADAGAHRGLGMRGQRRDGHSGSAQKDCCQGGTQVTRSHYTTSFAFV